jgi:hypothetical protein
MYSEATAKLADGFVLQRWLRGVVWRGLGRGGGLSFELLRSLRSARWVRFAAGECVDGFGTFRDFLGHDMGAGREVWLRFAQARGDVFVVGGGGAARAGSSCFKVVILSPICRPPFYGNYSRKRLEMEGKSLGNWIELYLDSVDEAA